MRSRLWLLLLVGPLCLLGLWGCEGEEGPAGPAGEDGTDLTASDESYFGGQGEQCMHCHVNIVETVRATGHDEAYSDLDAAAKQNPYCLQCHTTGYDDEVAFDGTVLTEGTDDFGYDDYFGGTTPEDAARRALLQGVQCESCHGPMGPDFNAHRPEVSYASRSDMGTSLSLCAPCHDNQLTEWATSGHASAAGGDITAFNAEHYAGVGSCQPCHTAEGFIWANDLSYGDRDFPEQVSFIGCVACHDPHVGDASPTGNPAQLRNITDEEVAYHPGLDDGDIGVPVMSGYGPAQTCVQCHHARRKSSTGGGSGSSGDVENQVAAGYAHFGPHASPQMDMFIGNGSYEIAGFDYSNERTTTHNNVALNATGCVGCHMRTSTDPSAHRIHEFEPTVADNCASCHPAATDFNVGNFQTDLEALMDQVAVALGLGYAGYMDLITAWDTADPHGSISVPTAAWQRESAYAIYFVYEDGSLGVHNPKYSLALIQNALTHAQNNNPPPPLFSRKR